MQVKSDFQPFAQNKQLTSTFYLTQSYLHWRCCALDFTFKSYSSTIYFDFLLDSRLSTVALEGTVADLQHFALYLPFTLTFYLTVVELLLVPTTLPTQCCSNATPCRKISINSTILLDKMGSRPVYRNLLKNKRKPPIRPGAG